MRAQDTVLSDAHVTVWGQALKLCDLTDVQLSYLEGLPKVRPDVRWIWDEMNRVWRDLGLDNTQPLSSQSEAVGRFYSHPVWLVNGLFTASDPASRQHRASMASHVLGLGAQRVADYGGGFGELALAIAKMQPHVEVCVVEPYPSKVGMRRLSSQPNVTVQPALGDQPFDVVLAQDVLEHVDDPIGLAHQLAQSVRPGGWVIFANCFHPMIDCHLPPTYHLRYTFDWVMQAMGLHRQGKVTGAVNARVFQVSGPLSLAAARRAETLSKWGCGSALNGVMAMAWQLKNAVSVRP